MTSQKNTKILIVEDEESLRKALMEQLTFEGYQVLDAANGQEGLQTATRESPDLILLDILMPIMDGFTMLQTLRKQSEYGKKVPVILLTNLSADSEDIVRKVAETEPAYYIVKTSMTMKEITKKIKERLSHSK